MSRITELLVHRCVAPLVRPFITAVRRTEEVEVTLVEVRCADGRSGWGEAATNWRVTGESYQSVAACVAGPISDALVGFELEDPECEARIRGAVYGNAAARAATECAVFDLRAAWHGVSLGSWLGATATRVRTDMTLSVASPTELARQAEIQVAAGFDHLKLKLDRSLDALAGVRAVRAAIGPEIKLRVDANQCWDVATAISFITESEDAGCDLEFVEQPLPATALDELAVVVAASNTPIVADESVRTASDVARIAALGAADLVNIKLAKTGGISAAVAAIRTARESGLGILIGCMMEGPVGVASAAALAAAFAPDQTHDLDAALWFRTTPVLGGARFAGATIELASAPGLGISGLSGEGT